MKIVDNVGSFTSHEFQLDREYEVEDSLYISGEAEVVDFRVKGIGNEGERKKIHRIRIKIAEIRQMDDGVYSEPTYTSTSGKSRTKRNRDKHFVYWQQQLSGKISFDAYMDMVWDKRDQSIEGKLQ